MAIIQHTIIAQGSIMEKPKGHTWSKQHMVKSNIAETLFEYTPKSEIIEITKDIPSRWQEIVGYLMFKYSINGRNS